MRREEAQPLAGLIALFAITAAWWALALWPVHTAPGWLERTRYVCFGINESGLPDAAGWIGLLGGPLGMLAILVVGWSDALWSLARRARNSRVIGVTLAGLALGSATLIVGAAVRVRDARVSLLPPDAEIAPAGLRRLDRDPPPLTLVTQAGDSLDIRRLKGRPVLVTFAFAHCSTVCPLIVTQALNAQAALRGTPDEPGLVIVTLDPWRDTPSRLPSIARAWRLPDDNAWVLSGSVAQVEAALDAWSVPRSRDHTTGDVTHPSLVYIIDRAGRMAYVAGGGTELVSLIQRL